MSVNLKYAQSLLEAEERKMNNITTDEIVEVKEEYYPVEFADTVTDGIYTISTLPVAEDKREKFKEVLKNDKFLNRYVHDTCNVAYLQNFNKHAKAAMIYGYHYMKIQKEL